MADLIDTDALVIGEQDAGYGQIHITRIPAVSTRRYAIQMNESGNLEIHISTDSGSSWALDQTYSDSNIMNHFSMAVDEDSNLFVCYVYGSAGSWYLKVKKRLHSAGTWSEVYSLAITLTAQPYALICFNRYQDRLLLFWTDDDSGLKVRSDYSDDNGGTWNGASTAGPTLTNAELYGVDSDPLTGKVWVTANENSGYTRSFRYSVDGTYDSTSYGSFYACKGADVVIDSSGNVYTVYYELAGGSYYLECDRNGSNTTIENFSTTDTIYYGNLTVGVDGDDNVYVYYTKKTDNKLYYRKYDAVGASWGSETEHASRGHRPSCEKVVPGSSNDLQLSYYGV